MNKSTVHQLAAALVRYAPRATQSDPALHAALAQATAHPGKLLRAQLAFHAASTHGFPRARALEFACALEYFHTASLVLDDLPCMDDAALRRGLPCVHRQHGDATAILTALALINRAYALVQSAFASQPLRVRTAATLRLDRALGVAGLVGGQALDLAFARTSRSARDVSRIAAQKTGALFELTLTLPALASRASGHERHHLRALCVYWGQLFQIADDLRDVLSSTYASGKTTQRDRALARPNFAHAAGLPHARARLARLHRQSRTTLATLCALNRRRWSWLHAAADALLQSTILDDEAETAAA